MGAETSFSDSLESRNPVYGWALAFAGVTNDNGG
jgi:hypothetical protein